MSRQDDTTGTRTEDPVRLTESERIIEWGSTEQTGLVAVLSHELRTPISSIVLLSQLLKEQQDGGSNAQVQEIADKIGRIGNGMLQTINEILTLSEAASEKVRIERSWICLDEIRHEMEELFYPYLSSGKITLTWQADEGIGRIRTDRFRIRLILINLLSNAFKFSSGGEVRVRVEFCPVNEERGDLEVSVFDSGSGIPVEKQEEIFKSFRKLENGAAATYPGTGLGLSIARQAARLLEGEITVRNRPEGGTIFTFVHPVDLQWASPKAPNHLLLNRENQNAVGVDSPQHGEAGDPVHEPPRSVLLVDDNSLHSTALREYLGFSIGTIHTADSAKETLRMLAEEEVDAVILDLTLPDASGERVLRSIRENPEWDGIRIILYTGHQLEGEQLDNFRRQGVPVVMKDVNSYRRLKELLMGVG